MKYKFLLLTLLIAHSSIMYSMPRRNDSIKLFGFVKGYPATETFTMVPPKLADVQKFMSQHEALNAIRSEYWQALGAVLVSHEYSFEQARGEILLIKGLLDRHIEKSSIPSAQDFENASFNKEIAQQLHDELNSSYVMVLGGVE